MGALTLTTASKNTVVDALVDSIDTGGGTAEIEITSVTDDYSAGNIVANIPLAATAFGAAASGSATIAGTPLSDTDAPNSGTAAQARIKDKAGTEICRGTVTVVGGGGFIELDALNIVAGGTVTITGGTISIA